MRVLGIDLSTDPAKTGAVVLEADGDQPPVVHVVNGFASDDVLVQIAHEVDIIGIDSPLGWPVPFIEALNSHASGDGWLPESDRVALRHRTTDLAVHAATGILPLSVSTDRLGATAMRCAHLQSRWATEAWEGQRAPRDGSGRLVEVYPAATLRVLGLPYRSYKGRDRASQREVIIDRLARWMSLGDLRAACVQSDDILDAAVAGLTALLAADGRTTSPGSGVETDRSLIEGWIHLPLHEDERQL
jgi:predicted nuclease with RNAse H fold